MYYEEVFRGLNRQRVKYLVVGGIALVLQGVSIPLICRDDLIKLKNAAGRPQALANINTLNQLT